MNPCAAINDLLPFQGSPFGQLGYFSNKAYSFSSQQILLFKRRGWDSNPRALADKRFSRPPRYDHFDTSPCLLFFRFHSVLSSEQNLLYPCPPFLSTLFFIFFKLFYFSRKTPAISRSSGVVILIFW